ncbi:MAG: hypothetical protein KDD45_12900, partial [Bdellovibrionales bacterium]|nr:hypothetical protein [Bdellovibrionales bacterium]
RSELAITDDSTKNKELFRDGANLAVIIISDANESPFNTGAVYENDPANLLKYLTAKWPNKITTFSSIVVKTNDTTCLYDKTSSNESYGKAYEFLSNTTDGIIGSVCEKDYSSQLKIIGQSIKDKISSFKLSCNPVDADKSGLVDFSITDSQNLSLSNYSISKNIVSFSNDLAVGIYKLVYTCIDE